MTDFQIEAEPRFIGDPSNWMSLTVRFPTDPAETTKIVRGIWKVLGGRDLRVVFPHLFLAKVRSKSEYQWLRGQLDRLVEHHHGDWRFVASFHHTNGVIRGSSNLERETVGSEGEFLAATLDLVPGELGEGGTHAE